MTRKMIDGGGVFDILKSISLFCNDPMIGA